MKTAVLGFLVVMRAVLLTAPGVEAQPAGKVPTVGIVVPIAPGDRHSLDDAFRKALQVLGWKENDNVRIEERFSAHQDALGPHASELVAMKVDVLVVWGQAAALAAKRATSQIPVVFLAAGDPVGFGLVQSLAHPGGNATGISFDAALDTYGKGLELLKEAVPSLIRVALIADPDPETTMGPGRQAMQTAARALGLTLFEVQVQASGDIVAAVRKAKGRGAQALYVWPSGLMFTSRKQLADVAVATRLPSIHPFKESALAGGLLAYAPSLTDIARRGAGYVDKILRGSKPGDLPVEQPTKLEFIINLKTAKALGLTIPPLLLLRADQIIE